MGCCDAEGMMGTRSRGGGGNILQSCSHSIHSSICPTTPRKFTLSLVLQFLPAFGQWQLGHSSAFVFPQLTCPAQRWRGGEASSNSCFWERSLLVLTDTWAGRSTSRAPFSYLTLFCLIVNEISGPKRVTHHIFYSVQKIAVVQRKKES